MGWSAAALVVSAIGTAYSTDNARRQTNMAKDAQKEAQVNQAKAEVDADQAMNRANPKSPDTSALMSQMKQAAKAGGSGTMLTGPQGVDPSTLNLGKTTLLGM